MYKLFLYLLFCTLIGFVVVGIAPLVSLTVDPLDGFLNGFAISFVIFFPRKLISRRCTQILNFLRTNRSNIVHALPGAFISAALCAVTLPVVAASTAWIVVWSTLAFAAVICIFLYLQGSFSS